MDKQDNELDDLFHIDTLPDDSRVCIYIQAVRCLRYCSITTILMWLGTSAPTVLIWLLRVSCLATALFAASMALLPPEIFDRHRVESFCRLYGTIMLLPCLCENSRLSLAYSVALAAYNLHAWDRGRLFRQLDQRHRL